MKDKDFEKISKDFEKSIQGNQVKLLSVEDTAKAFEKQFDKITRGIDRMLEILSK
jgi:hypothetical protein